MVGAVTNADALAQQYRGMASRLSDALQRGLLASMEKIDELALENLGGNGAPFTYPVPVRTGNLRGQLREEQLSTTAIEVADVAGYAWAVHEGVFNQWAGRGKTRIVQKPERPFLTDALEGADPLAIITDELERTVFQ